MIGLVAMLLMQTASANILCDQAEADRGIQSEMNRCAHKTYLVADEALNAQWSITADSFRRIDESWQEQDVNQDAPCAFAVLLESQRAWLKYRDAQCASEAAKFLGGSILPLIRSSCLARVTELRTAELKN